MWMVRIRILSTPSLPLTTPWSPKVTKLCPLGPLRTTTLLPRMRSFLPRRTKQGRQRIRRFTEPETKQCSIGEGMKVNAPCKDKCPKFRLELLIQSRIKSNQELHKALDNQLEPKYTIDILWTKHSNTRVRVSQIKRLSNSAQPILQLKTWTTISLANVLVKELMLWCAWDFIRLLTKKLLSKSMKSLNCSSRTEESRSSVKWKLWKNWITRISQNFMRPSNPTNKCSWSWNMSMGALCMGTSKWNLIDKCQNLRQNSSGDRLCRQFITVIRGMWPTETSNSKTYCWMRPKSA